MGRELAAEFDIMAPMVETDCTLAEHSVKTWPELVDLVTSEPYKHWAFRGQAKSSWSMWSSISRHLWDHKVHDDYWRSQERRTLRVFKRKAHLFLQHIPDPDDDFQWLGLMQHHGAPTRLLDFTWSPYVAAFFALERAKGDAALWGVNAAAVRDNAPKLELPDGEHVTPDEMNPREPGNMLRYFIDTQLPFAWIGEPYVMNRRLIAQSGTFLVPGRLDRPVEDILSCYPDPGRTIIKIVLQGEELRREALDQLYHMNIGSSTLFPDLDGLARSLAYELEYNWACDVRASAPDED